MLFEYLTKPIFRKCFRIVNLFKPESCDQSPTDKTTDLSSGKSPETAKATFFYTFPSTDSGACFHTYLVKHLRCSRYHSLMYHVSMCQFETDQFIVSHHTDVWVSERTRIRTGKNVCGQVAWPAFLLP